MISFTKRQIVSIMLRIPAMVGFVAIICMSIVFAIGNEQVAKVLAEIVYLSFLVSVVMAFIERCIFQRANRVEDSR